MGSFKMKEGKPSIDEIPIDDWKAREFVFYFQRKFKEVYGLETRRPMGQILIHVNSKVVNRLFRLEGRSIDIHPNQLYKNFIDWVIGRKKVRTFRIWLLSKEEIMIDYLDLRAEEIMNNKVGSVEDFRKWEEDKIKKAKEYFERNN